VKVSSVSTSELQGVWQLCVQSPCDWRTVAVSDTCPTISLPLYQNLIHHNTALMQADILPTKEITCHQTMLKKSWSRRKTCSNIEQSHISLFDQLIILPCSTFMLNEMDVICCNCDFVYGPTVLLLQLKSDPAKSRSRWISGIGYPNPAENQYPSIPKNQRH